MFVQFVTSSLLLICSRFMQVSEYRIASIGDGPAASALQDSDFQRFRRETDDFSVNWQLHSIESAPEYDLRIYSRTSQANYNIWKTWCSIKSIPPKQLYDACMDVEYKKTWDGGVLDCFQVESLDEQSSVIYTATQVRRSNLSSVCLLILSMLDVVTYCPPGLWVPK
jgi:hypothetical protein